MAQRSPKNFFATTMPDYQCLLHEVVDKENKPLCLLPEKEILNQKLWRREVAILLTDSDGHALLRENDAGFGFSSQGLLPAFMAATDFCGQLLARDWGNGHLHARQCGFSRPGAANPYSFVTVFEAMLSPQALTRLGAAPGAIRVDSVERKALQDRGYSFSPLLLKFLP